MVFQVYIPVLVRLNYEILVASKFKYIVIVFIYTLPNETYSLQKLNSSVIVRLVRGFWKRW